MVNLLLRFYDPNEGRITIDGVDLRTFRPEDHRARFGLDLTCSQYSRGVRSEVCMTGIRAPLHIRRNRWPCRLLKSGG